MGVLSALLSAITLMRRKTMREKERGKKGGRERERGDGDWEGSMKEV